MLEINKEGKYLKITSENEITSFLEDREFFIFASFKDLTFSEIKHFYSKGANKCDIIECIGWKLYDDECERFIFNPFDGSFDVIDIYEGSYSIWEWKDCE